MVLIIAEAGVNHNGSLSVAKELVEAAKDSGADIIKFQFFEADDLVTPNAKKANYQINDSYETQSEMLKKLELTYEDQMQLKEFCEEKNIFYVTIITQNLIIHKSFSKVIGMHYYPLNLKFVCRFYDFNA